MSERRMRPCRGMKERRKMPFSAAACGDGSRNPPAEQHSDDEINQHVQGLSYDRNVLLNVRNITGTEARTASGDPVDTDESQGTSLLACCATDYNLETNADDVAILRPTVAMMVYKQVFYTVTLDTPASPAMMFAESVLPSQCYAQMTN